MCVAATEVLKSRFLMKTCGPWRRDEKVGLPPLEKRGLPNLKRGAFGVKETCGKCTREEGKKKKKQEKKRDLCSLWIQSCFFD